MVLHRITFKHPVNALKFSPNGKYIAVAAGKLLQIWKSPGFRREVFGFELVRTFADCNDKILAIDWDTESKYLIVGSKDLTGRFFCVDKIKGSYKKPFLLLGHRDSVVGCFFGVDKKSNRVNKAFTIARDGFIFSWGYSSTDANHDSGDERMEDEEPPSPGTPDRDGEGGEEIVKKRKDFDGKESGFGVVESYLSRGKWELLRKDCFMQAPAKLTACDYHKGLDLVVVGFSNGVFGLYQMPDFVCIHLLSISREKITTAVFNDLGNWLTFGCAKLGQLLVWEWRSESYIMKQQGHYFDVNTLAYSPDSQLLATGADDNKVKVIECLRDFFMV